MDQDSRELVDLWTADLFGLPLSMVWQKGVTVGMHAGLGDYSGIFVAGRDGGVHVSLPDWAGRALIDELVEEQPYDLLEPKFWKAHPVTEGHKVIGPSIHAFTNTQFESPSKVEQIPASDIASWRDSVSRKKWDESGFGGEVPIAFAIRSGDDIAAAANLTLFRGVPSDVGVLTHPKYRGKGYATRVARAATAYAVRNHGLARYRSLADNDRSRSISASLGFEDYFTQLSVVPRD